MRRRRLLAAGAAATLALGAGVAWRLRREAAPAPAPAAGGRPPAAAAAAAPGDRPADAFWQLRFERPGAGAAGSGGELALDRWRGRPLLVNFWGSWCPPCVEEMPALDRFARGTFARRGGTVVGLAVDNPTAVREFLARQPVSYPVGLAGFEGTTLARELGNAQGGLPFTVLIDGGGRIVQRHAGRVDEAVLERWAAAL